MNDDSREQSIQFKLGTRGLGYLAKFGKEAAALIIIRIDKRSNESLIKKFSLAKNVRLT